jgi:hypothetical protein
MTGRHVSLLIVLMLNLTALAACQSRAATPADVQAAYSNLVASLDTGAPGVSVLRLEEFGRRHARYEIAGQVEEDVAAWRARLQPAYLRARDLARQGEFEAAESVLKDLALVTDAPAGRQSREFLAFEFHKLKASRLLLTGDTDGAAAAARQLLGGEAGEDQVAAAQQLLDATSIAELGARMNRTTALQSAARALHVAVVSSYADNGQYPDRLSLDDPVLSTLLDTGSLRVIERLDDYRATHDTFSVIVVAKGSGQRLRVTHRGIEDVPQSGRP